MENYFKKGYAWVLKHKVISFIIIVVIVGGGYYWYTSANKTAGKVTYVTQTVQTGTVVKSISGSGQVSASNEVDLKSQVSENVVYVPVVAGQQVSAGQLLMEFDTTDAQKSVRDADLSLQSAQLSLQKTQSGNSQLPLTATQDQNNLDNDYNSAFSTLSNTFLDLPSIMSGLNDVLYGNELDKTFQQNLSYYFDSINPYNSQAAGYMAGVNTSYQTALTAYNKNFSDYNAMSRSSNQATIDSMLAETYQTTQSISNSIQDINSFIQLYENTDTAQGLQINPVANTQLATLNADTGKINTDLSNILNIQSTLQNDKNTLAADSVSSQSQGLSVQSAQLSVQQAQNALSDAKDNLANCYIYAPFSGIVATLDYVKGDAATSGSDAVTLITNQSITEIPFNEVDITSIKVGQKATLTFDAISGLTVAGTVTQIDTLGTVSQGVVNYNVELAFDASGTQVKPGMSVTANIITDVAQNVLVVPNSAIKTSGSTQYVQILVNGVPVRKVVQTGLSNDTDTQITSGLTAGQSVVTQTITTSATTVAATSSTSSALRGLTGGAAAGGFSGGGGFGGGRTTTARGG